MSGRFATEVAIPRYVVAQCCRLLEANGIAIKNKPKAQVIRKACEVVSAIADEQLGELNPLSVEEVLETYGMLRKKKGMVKSLDVNNLGDIIDRVRQDINL